MSWRPKQHTRSAHQRGLGTDWRRIVALAIQCEPFCHNSRCTTPASPLTGEHRIKRGDGGPSTPANTTVLCEHCNKRRDSGAPLDAHTVAYIQTQLA